MCSCNTPKKEKWFQKGILKVKAATYTWRESGDWVALNNNIQGVHSCIRLGNGAIKEVSRNHQRH